MERQVSNVETELKPCVPEQMSPPINTRLIANEADLGYVADFLSRTPIFGFDLETNIADSFIHRKIRTIQVGSKTEQYVIDLWELAGRDQEYLRDLQGHRGKAVPTSGPFQRLREVLVPALDSKTHLKVGHNLEFEYETISWCLGIYPWHLYCTYLAEKVLYAGLVPFKIRGFWALDDLCARYFHLKISKEEQKGFWPDGTPLEPLTQSQIVYTGLDTRLPLGVRAYQVPALEKHGLTKTAQIEFDAIPAFRDMHINGVFLDKDMWMAVVEKKRAQHAENVAKLDAMFLPIVGEKKPPMSDEDLAVLEKAWADLGADSPEEVAIKEQIKQTKDKEQKALLRAERDRLAEARKEKRKAAREVFSEASKYRTWYRKEGPKMEGKAAINLGSPAQIEAALLKVKGINKTNLKDTNDKTLKKLADKFPIVKAITDYRETQKLLGSYGEEYVNFISPETGRVHAHFNQLEAETGRTSSDNPNLQQVPKLEDLLDEAIAAIFHVEAGKKLAVYRACFRARPGWKLITRDLDGCELRIMADAAGETIWIDAFNRKEDIHELVAFNVTVRTKGEPQWMAWSLPGCKFNEKRKKCDCPEHKKKRDQNKSVNFGVAYGLSVYGLMDQLNCDEQTASEILKAWHAANPTLSTALERWSEEAQMKGEARTPLGRRRLFKKPSFAEAREKLILDWREKGWEGFPTNGQVAKKLKAILSSIRRAGGNHKIQGGNADLVKLAIGCGEDPQGVAYLWHHTRPDKDFAYLENLVHDEVVYEAREADAPKAEELVGDALERAGAEFVKSVRMTTDGHIDDYWRK